MNAQNSSGNKPKLNLTKKNKSNTFRSIIFTLLSIIFIAYCINLYGNHNIKMKEVPPSPTLSLVLMMSTVILNALPYLAMNWRLPLKTKTSLQKPLARILRERFMTRV